jgi:CobQ-like glutamine amidotransferase family enzyme
MKNDLTLTIGWLYPELMNIYGDRGNIAALDKRCQWRNIKTELLRLDVGFSRPDLKRCDILLMGGAQDRQQEAVANDLFEKKEDLRTMVEKGIPGVYVCGAYQMLGNYYKEANGDKIEGLGILDLYTDNPGQDKKRLIGNCVAYSEKLNYTFIGFENHGGRTHLGKNVEPFGRVVKGYGNNGEDKTEGAIYKNSIGTYLHGPLLPKNPLLTDYLIKTTLEIKYHTKVPLKTLDDELENQARKAIAKRLSVAI